MRYSGLVARIGGAGVAAWDIHYQALAAEKAGADVIVLSIGDPDLDTPPEVVEAAVAALHAGDTHYAEVPGRATLREAVAARYRSRFGMTVEAEKRPDQRRRTECPVRRRPLPVLVR
jgi:aspartate/methionine/tyrosine aminotransferase